MGVGLLPVPLRNPALAAMEIATVARMFPGRFLPGLGHGVIPWMVQAGAAVASPITLLREYTVAARALLAVAIPPSKNESSHSHSCATPAASAASATARSRSGGSCGRNTTPNTRASVL